MAAPCSSGRSHTIYTSHLHKKVVGLGGFAPPCRLRPFLRNKNHSYEEPHPSADRRDGSFHKSEIARRVLLLALTHYL